MARSKTARTSIAGKLVVLDFDISNISDREAEARAHAWLAANPHENGDRVMVTDQAVWRSGRNVI